MAFFRDTDSDSVHAWDQIVQDPTRHPDWDGVEKNYQEYKLSTRCVYTYVVNHTGSLYYLGK